MAAEKRWDDESEMQCAFGVRISVELLIRRLEMGKFEEKIFFIIFPAFLFFKNSKIFNFSFYKKFLKVKITSFRNF